MNDTDTGKGIERRSRDRRPCEEVVSRLRAVEVARRAGVDNEPAIDRLLQSAAARSRETA